MIRIVATIFFLTIASPALADLSPPPSTATAGALPADFEGKVSYFGNNTGKMSGARRGAPVGPSKECARPDHGCIRLVGGSLEVELIFAGDIVRGHFHGNGGLDSGELIGRRTGAQCELFDRSDGSMWTGLCDEQGFRGHVKSVDNAALGVDIGFTTIGTRSVDFGRVRELREQARRQEARIRVLHQRLDSNAPIDYRLDAAVELDSYGWTSDGYLPNSLSGLKKGKGHGGDYTVYGDFRLKKGGTGWVRATVQGNSFTCLEMWDLPGVCRPILSPLPIDIPPEDEAAG